RELLLGGACLPARPAIAYFERLHPGHDSERANNDRLSRERISRRTEVSIEAVLPPLQQLFDPRRRDRSGVSQRRTPIGVVGVAPHLLLSVGTVADAPRSGDAE